MLVALVFSLVGPSILVRTLAMRNIAEVRMKRQWKVRRQFQPTTNAERRWDQAYQHLLEWTLPIDRVRDQVASFRPTVRPRLKRLNSSWSGCESTWSFKARRCRRTTFSGMMATAEPI